MAETGIFCCRADASALQKGVRAQPSATGDAGARAASVPLSFPDCWTPHGMKAQVPGPPTVTSSGRPQELLDLLLGRSGGLGIIADGREA